MLIRMIILIINYSLFIFVGIIFADACSLSKKSWEET